MQSPESMGGYIATPVIYKAQNDLHQPVATSGVATTSEATYIARPFSL